MRTFLRAVLMGACSALSLVATAFTCEPDYAAEITLPSNIAPLNFDILDATTGVCRVTLTAPDGDKLEAKGPQVRWKASAWHAFLARHAGTACVLSVGAQSSRLREQSIVWTISSHAIDSHLTYRLIPPGYNGFGLIGIWQRDLTSFDERALYRNVQISHKQCVNCHTYNHGDPETYLFHSRLDHEGTVVRSPKHGLKKVDLKFPGAFAQGTYPAWHPSGDFICFSENRTFQVFYEAGPTKIEVADLRSDLFLYSLAEGTATVIENAPETFESFPAWSPSGRELYTARARTEFREEPEKRFKKSPQAFATLGSLRYDLVVRTFDPATRAFGEPRMLFDAQKEGASATFPRVSPDGRWLVFTRGNYGVFHIWHREADLWICDLRTGAMRALDEINSPDTESYHCFSSDGNWMVFSSRREDGSYTRPYFTHFDAATGRFTRPFLLPVASPDAHRRRLESYNVPEFSTGPVRESPRQLRRMLESDSVKLR